MRVIDLSVVLTDGFPVYPGDPPVSITSKVTHRVEGCNILSLCLGTHSGTHVDLPRHHLEGGAGADTFPLETFVGEAVVVSIPKDKNQAITVSDLEPVDIRPGDILLIHSGWDRCSGSPQFYKDFPYFELPVADYLISKRVKAVGCDMASVDPPTPAAPVHHALLSAGIGIIEAVVNLEQLAGMRVQFIGLPLKIAEGDGSPVRAVAVTQA